MFLNDMQKNVENKAWMQHWEGFFLKKKSFTTWFATSNKQ